MTEARRRLKRAHEQLEHLKLLLPGRAQSQTPNNPASIRPQPDGKTYDIVVAVVEPPPEFRLTIGDIVHDLRTSLDYLTYRLALRHGLPAAGRTPQQLRDIRKLSFLICPDEQRFRSAAGNVQKLIGESAVEAMETLQKYKGLDPRGATLWALSQLDNITKHRMLAMVYQELDHANVTIKIGDQTFVGTVTNPTREPLRGGAKLFSLFIDAPHQPQRMDVEVLAVHKMVFSDTDGVCDGDNVIALLRECCNACASIVDEFEQRFF